MPYNIGYNICKKTIYSPKNCRTNQHCDTILCWKMPGVNISSDLEEAMFETGESLSVYS